MSGYGATEALSAIITAFIVFRIVLSCYVVFVTALKNQSTKCSGLILTWDILDLTVRPPHRNNALQSV
jgi:hypothetical protein